MGRKGTERSANDVIDEKELERVEAAWSKRVSDPSEENVASSDGKIQEH